MAYEMDFIGVNEETQDATAICMRWKNQDGTYTVGVVDGGFSAYGNALKEHLNKYYFEDGQNKVIDFVVCSHPHQDHAAGLIEILENFTVKRLFINLPWNYIDELYDKVNDGRITPASLETRLKEKYSYISKLEEIAEENNVTVYSALEGTIICNKLTILSPSKDFYLQLLVESEKTPLEEQSSVFEQVMHMATELINKIKETWRDEKLKEDVSTEPDNETSTVILGEMDDEYFLLTGDVGIRGLREAIDYASSLGESIMDTVSVYEIPHHGGRHNISPSILNQLVGGIVEENGDSKKEAFVCSGKNSDHPLQMVVNAFNRRGVKVYKASGKTICHQKGSMPVRDGWSTISNIPFNSDVEEWD